MVIAVEARTLNLPFLSPQITSFFYDPNSLSLALMHFDSSFSLFPSFSPFSISPNCNLPPPQTLISPPCSSACFVPLNPNPNHPDDKRVVFVTVGPHSGGSKILLRFYLLGKDGKFGDFVHVGCSQNGVNFDGKFGVIIDLSHGLKVIVSGGVNYLALYSASGGKLWVFGVKLVENGSSLRLVKCAVIDCRFLVSSICLSYGFLVLGELRGVRVFPLRAVVKGQGGGRRKARVARGKGENLNAVEGEASVKVEGWNSKMPNGVVRVFDDSDKNIGDSSSSKLLPNGHGYSGLDGVSSSSSVDAIVKPRSLKFRQDSCEWGMQFVLFNDCVHEGIESKAKSCRTTKAIAIQALSREKFLILESNGDLHVLHVSKSGSSRMTQLLCTIQVQHFAAFPDASADSQTVWVSDGLYSVHLMVIPGSDTTEKEIDGDNNDGKSIQSSVTQAIFTSENIQDMLPLASNRVLILGRDNLYAYAIS